MAAPDIEMIKTWCRVGSEFDTMLPAMITAATNLASHECETDFQTAEMPEEVQQWVAINVAYWINNPDAASASSKDPSPWVDRLLDRARTYGATE